MNYFFSFKTFFLLAFTLVTFNLSFGQSYTKAETEGKINVIAEPGFQSILNKKLKFDVYNSGYMGYRVQIYFDSGNNSKQGAYDVAESFIELFPDVPVYITFRQPYYRVRVGDFRNKIDADKILNSAHKTFTSSFVVKEYISIFDEPYTPENIEIDPFHSIDDTIDDNENIY